MHTRPRFALFALACSCLQACSPHHEPPMLGYVEVEPTRLASPVGGRLVTLSVQRGDEVQAQAPLFALDTELEQPTLAEARARQAQSQAQASDLASGKRPAELDALRARVSAARSALQLGQNDLARQEALAQQGFTSKAGLDGMRERVQTLNAQLAQAQADLRAGELAGREAQRQAAQAAIQVAQAQQASAQARLAQKSISAPVAARVEDTYFRVGEWVPAGTPVLSLLPDHSSKLRFYIPEPRLAQLPVGSQVRVSCDGCGPPFVARIRWVARSAEFTPPVIYSKDNRSQLVFKAEAVPEQARELVPGLPVEITVGTTP